MTALNAKQEAIKKAYGEENFNLFKDIINENGWIGLSRYGFDEDWDTEDKFDKMVSEIEFEESFEDGMNFYRPKSLQGIENNNGWIKIESEADLPKEDYYGELFEVGFLDDIGYFHHERKRCSLKSLKWMFERKLVTHYQPIEKPKPPIY